MKLVIEIPDWASERHISVMAGMELLAYKPYGKNILYLKTERCNFCGWCCEALASRSFPRDSSGACIYLETVGEDKVCGLKTSRPWRCCWSDPHLTEAPGAEEHCCITYDEILIGE